MGWVVWFSVFGWVVGLILRFGFRFLWVISVVAGFFVFLWGWYNTVCVVSCVWCLGIWCFAFEVLCVLNRLVFLCLNLVWLLFWGVGSGCGSWASVCLGLVWLGFVNFCSSVG